MKCHFGSSNMNNLWNDLGFNKELNHYYKESKK
jgi:hypothetical protein